MIDELNKAFLYKRNLYVRFLFSALICFFFITTTGQIKPISSTEIKGGDIVGRWDLKVKEDNNRIAASWLEIEISGFKTLVGRFVGDGGSARPISEIKLDNGTFNFSIPAQWEQSIAL